MGENAVIETLVQIGAPAGLVILVVLAIYFWNSYKTFAKSALFVVLIACTVLIAIELYIRLPDSNLKVVVSPQDVTGYSSSGLPVDLSIRVTKSERDLTQIVIPKHDEGTFVSRPLTVAMRNDNFLDVNFQGKPIGKIEYQRLEDAGWRHATNCKAGERTPLFWHTNRVHAGEIAKLGSSPYGALSLKAEAFSSNGEAIVSLQLASALKPQPIRVHILNQQHKVQSFLNTPEFYIVVRAADFMSSPPWAAFSVFSTQ